VDCCVANYCISALRLHNKSADTLRTHVLVPTLSFLLGHTLSSLHPHCRLLCCHLLPSTETHSRGEVTICCHHRTHTVDCCLANYYMSALRESSDSADTLRTHVLVPTFSFLLGHTLSSLHPHCGLLCCHLLSSNETHSLGEVTIYRHHRTHTVDCCVAELLFL
jgi:hypothetical protein